MRSVLRFFCFGLYILVGFSSLQVNSQIYAPTRDWRIETQYLHSNSQDSIFVFFGSKPVSLRAQFSDSSQSAYTWYRYNESIQDRQKRFEPLTGIADSVANGITMGGYKVEVKRLHDDSVQTYVCWVMVDNVSIIDLRVNRNTCQSLELILRTSPNFFDIGTLFTYYDLSLSTHQERLALPAGGYFANHTFSSLNPEIQVKPKSFSLPYIFVENENPQNGKLYGPLFDSKYRLLVTPPFGKPQVVVETEDVTAVATQAAFEISLWDEKLGAFGASTSEPKGEALLEIKLESKALNSDSVFWKVINDKLRIERGKDSILWRDSSDFDTRKDAYPPKRLMIPGFYSVEHVTTKRTNALACVDTVLKMVEVDTSFLKNIPNVFTPDGSNPYFKISEDDFKSIKSFSISIFGRTGKPVYTYSGNPKEWQGWDGKVSGTRGDASPGVYYYVIDAVGWDGVRYRKGNYKGFLHLYR